MERGLTCIILSCIYNGNLVSEIGIKYTKTVWDNLSVYCYAKPVFHFPGVETFFQCISMRSDATGNANAKECRDITILFGKSLKF